MISYNSCRKDSLPRDTIRKDRKILTDLNLNTSEQWFTPTEGLYSLHLSVIGTSIYSNGKGSTIEYTLASAYGELLERIQNLTFYRMSTYADYFFSDYPYKVGKEECITQSICEIGSQEKFF